MRGGEDRHHGGRISYAGNYQSSSKFKVTPPYSPLPSRVRSPQERIVLWREGPGRPSLHLTARRGHQPHLPLLAVGTPGTVSPQSLDPPARDVIFNGIIIGGSFDCRIVAENFTRRRYPVRIRAPNLIALFHHCHQPDLIILTQACA